MSVTLLNNQTSQSRMEQLTRSTFANSGSKPPKVLFFKMILNDNVLV